MFKSAALACALAVWALPAAALTITNITATAVDDNGSETTATGNGQILVPGSTFNGSVFDEVSDDKPSSQNTLFAFREKTRVAYGSISSYLDEKFGTPNPLLVDSYLVFFNPNVDPGDFGGPTGWTPSNWRGIEATLSFTTKIVGLITDTSKMNATDNLLGHGDVTYTSIGANPGNRGLEFGPQEDPILDSLNLLDAKQLGVDLKATQSGDWMRVVVVTTPVPAAGLLLPAAVGGLVLAARRKRHRAA